jgi:hypothetical protein
VPFLWLQFSDPFLPLNLLLYVGTMAIYLRLACLFLSPELRGRLGIKNTPFGL